MSILTPEMATLIYQAEILNVLDGDTLDMRVNLGMGCTQNARIRLEWIDCPEIFGVKKDSNEYSNGMIAKSRVGEWIEDAPTILYLRAEHKGIHGRWLGEIWKAIGGNSLNDFMIGHGYSNESWYWYSQEPLIEDWFDGEEVTTPDGKGLPIWYNWGRPVFIGSRSVMLARFN